MGVKFNAYTRYMKVVLVELIVGNQNAFDDCNDTSARSLAVKSNENLHYYHWTCIILQ